MDVKTAYLNGILTEDIYMEQPPGFTTHDHKTSVCHLHKALYGLKQSGHIWNSNIDTYLKSLNFLQCPDDPCLYRLQRSATHFILIGIYVDDLLIVSNYDSDLQWIKHNLTQRYTMTDCGDLQEMLGLQIERDRTTNTLILHQSAYIQRMLLHYDMLHCKTAYTPMEINLQFTDSPPYSPGFPSPPFREEIGSLLYAANATRPDISFAVGKLAQHSNNYGPTHWSAVKRIFRYL